VTLVRAVERRCACGGAVGPSGECAACRRRRLERVGVVERNILRLALAELDEASTPSRVVIDEAVKLAHWFAGARAPAFINGVLDAIAHETGAL